MLCCGEQNSSTSVTQVTLHQHRNSHICKTRMNVLRKIFPVLDWAASYEKAWFKGDLMAGLTVGVMLIPQGMAYALIAGLPPEYGLYASLIPLVVYSLLGTSRQLAVGPVAMDSLFVAITVSAMAVAGSEHYIELAILLALMIGAMQLVFGLIRLGFLVNFLSRPVVVGFTTAAALIISLNQVKYIFGTPIPRSNQVHTLVMNIGEALGNIHPATFIFGVLAIGLILAMKKWAKKIPSSLVLVVIGTLLVYALGWHESGISVVGVIPSGLPVPQVPSFTSEEVMSLLPAAFALSLIAFMEAISVAKAIESRQDQYKINANQELIALGLSNIVGSLFRSYPVTGGFSRTAVNYDAGAKTGLAGIISAAVILITLLFLTDLFYFLPHVVLAAIIIVAVSGLIDLVVPVKLWKTDKKEFAMYAVTLITTATVGIMEGIIVGVLLSLVLLIYKVSTPHMAVVGKFPGTNLYRNVERFIEVDIDPEILILRFDARLFYANMNYFRDHLVQFEQQKGEQLKAIIIDGSGINSIDSSAIEMVKKLIENYQKRNILLLFSGLKGPVRDVFQQHEIYATNGEDHFFVNIENAEKYAKGEIFDPQNTVARQSNV